MNTWQPPSIPARVPLEHRIEAMESFYDGWFARKTQYGEFRPPAKRNKCGNKKPDYAMRARIVQAIKDHPAAHMTTIAKMAGCSLAMAYKIRSSLIEKQDRP